MMKINNIEYDLDELLQHHSANSVEAARELRAATGVTLKEAMKILKNYEKGIMPNSQQPKTQKRPYLLPIISSLVLVGVLGGILSNQTNSDTATSDAAASTTITKYKSLKNDFDKLQSELELAENLFNQTSKQIEELKNEDAKNMEPEATEPENPDTDAGTDTATDEYTNTASLSTPSSLKYGKLLDANPNGGIDGNTLVIKAKIEPNLTNDLTISQNYHNIIDLVSKQHCDSFNSIDYWAVADMADGSEEKVISFLVNSECINGIKNETIVATTLDQYLEDLWILPSLQQ